MALFKKPQKFNAIVIVAHEGIYRNYVPGFLDRPLTRQDTQKAEEALFHTDKLNPVVYSMRDKIHIYKAAIMPDDRDDSVQNAANYAIGMVSQSTGIEPIELVKKHIYILRGKQLRNSQYVAHMVWIGDDTLVHEEYGYGWNHLKYKP